MLLTKSRPMNFHIHRLIIVLHNEILILLQSNTISYVLSIPSIYLLITYQLLATSTSFWLNS